MKSMLVINRIKISNANAIAGLTWGFPAITNFLGFTHALSRYFQEEQGLAFNGCGVICHDFQHKTRKNQYGRHSFSLTRNPLTKKGETAPFNEEGKMHMTISLVVEADFYPEDLDCGETSVDGAIGICQQKLTEKIQTMRLAGGLIESVESVKLISSSHEIESKTLRRNLRKLLPGFALVDSSHLLSEHFQQQKEKDEQISSVSAWLDFAALKLKAQSTENHEVGTEKQEKTQSSEWERIPKPGQGTANNNGNGYLVPLMVGYKGISPLYENHQVNNTRDDVTPFRFVESTYGVGQWVSPHRIQTAEQLLWQYHQEDDWYLCTNSYHRANANTEKELDLNEFI